MPFNKGALVFTGSFPDLKPFGTIWFYNKSDAVPFRKVADLRDYPRVIAPQREEALIATTSGVEILHADFSHQEIAQLPLFLTPPNSIVENDQGQIYLGARSIVIKLTPQHGGYVHDCT